MSHKHDSTNMLVYRINANLAVRNWEQSWNASGIEIPIAQDKDKWIEGLELL